MKYQLPSFFFILIMSLFFTSCGGDTSEQQSSTSTTTEQSTISVSPTAPAKDDIQSQIAVLYKKILGRDADPLGLQHWSTIVNEGQMNLKQVEVRLATSGEFYSRFIKGKEPKAAAQEIIKQLNPSVTTAKVDDLTAKLVEDGENWQKYITNIVKKNQ